MPGKKGGSTLFWCAQVTIRVESGLEYSDYCEETWVHGCLSRTRPLKSGGAMQIPLSRKASTGL